MHRLPRKVFLMTKSNKRKLDEASYFKKIIKPNLKKIDPLVVTDINEWSRVNLWDTKKPIYLIDDARHDSGIVVDLKQMQNLARTFDEIIKMELSK